VRACGICSCEQRVCTTGSVPLQLGSLGFVCAIRVLVSLELGSTGLGRGSERLQLSGMCAFAPSNSNSSSSSRKLSGLLWWYS
jgi:hypothetical protein